MTNKNKIIIISIVSSILLICLSVSVYIYQNTAKQTVKKAITSDDINNYLTDNFIDQINNSGTNKEYLDSAVSNYSVSKSVKTISTQEKSEDELEGTITIIVTTINTKTGFKVITEDTYKSTIIRVGSSWKIDSYELINSKTIK